ncbi:hypothetical protein PO124_07095 [Bacillus licheniformis]|nr:hypothetical protein [Bacillus licheniformis]
MVAGRQVIALFSEADKEESVDDEKKPRLKTTNRWKSILCHIKQTAKGLKGESIRSLSSFKWKPGK